MIVGEPGVGKSAIAAWLSLTRPEVVGVHFCTQQNSRSLNPYEFVACLVGPAIRLASRETAKSDRIV